MRTRFAPSPTGSLHVGGLRTALYSYLMAKQTEGQFLLRIEDTDQSREVPGAVDIILRGLHWAGLDPDEGVVMIEGVPGETGNLGPYYQSKRLEKYRHAVDQLVSGGHAYPCFCTPERLEQMRSAQAAKHQAPMYDRHCLTLSFDEVQMRLKAGDKHVIRMKVPHEETITFEDDIRGQVSFQGKTIDDQVLLKSDGFPTYHLAHVVDDHLMGIDLVIRGEEWLSSLPKHLLLFRWLGWTAPRYAHVPLLLNKDKSKLSKRQNSVSVEEYIAKGYLPEAMLNFLAMLGWNDGTTQELFTMQELMEKFSLDRVQKSGAIFDLDKLNWLQGQWIRKLTTEEFSARIFPLVINAYPEATDDKDFAKKAALIQERITFFQEAPEMLGYFYHDPFIEKDLVANKKQKVTEEDVPRYVKILIDTLEPIDEKDWNEATLESVIRSAVEKNELKLGQLLWPLRALLTGREYSPGAFEVAAALGKEMVMKRLTAPKMEQ
ncbi:MAG TPA: glutamate--tRNA ligase [Candidatus Peribacteraceae bacterium]|nr:glutamate--tRNA ligase [Candidatus Peribacteraceae bacterium]